MLLGWVPFVVGLFLLLRPRHAVLVAVVGGWLILPMSGFTSPGLPSYDKFTAIVLSALLGVIICDTRALFRFRPRWFDLPILVMCISPLPTSLVNDLGLYDGLSATLRQIILYGLPYLFGRLYFADRQAMRDLAMAIMIGGLVYIPLCLMEVRLSPQLNDWIYGFHPDAFAKTYRMGGYRPVVFLGHGITVGFWMAASAVVTAWLWRSRTLRHLGGVPVSGLAVVQILLMPIYNALAGLFVMLLALGSIVAGKVLNIRLVLLAIMLIPPAYVGTRVVTDYSAEPLVGIASIVSENRAASLEFRIEMESRLMKRAWERPILGWGGWGRSRPDRDAYSEIDTVPDSLWILAFGQRGLIGLLALWGVLLLPAWLCVKQSRRNELLQADHGAAGAIAVVLIMFAFDCAINSKVTPVWFMIAGSLSSYQAMAWPKAKNTAAAANAATKREPSLVHKVGWT